MIYIYYIDRIARFLFCGLLPLCVIIACLILICKQDKHCSLDIAKLKENKMAVIMSCAGIILLIILAILVMNNHIYTTVTSLIHDLLADENNVAIQLVFKIIAGVGLLTYMVYKLFVKITVYPELAFRIVPGQSKKKKSRKFFQFATQFWNAGLFPHHHLKVTMTKCVREKHGDLKSFNVSMHEPAEDDYIKNVFFSQNERAYTWFSSEDKWDVDLQSALFEYLEVTITSEARFAKFTKSLEISETKRFYPEDIHQGDFMDMRNKKVVPQSLVTLYNNKEYISAKRTIQKWDEGLRYTQCVLMMLIVILAIVLACLDPSVTQEAILLSQRIFIALFFVLTAWRIILDIPIKATILPSSIYGEQQK